jgi:hypothetical protein
LARSGLGWLALARPNRRTSGRLEGSIIATIMSCQASRNRPSAAHGGSLPAAAASWCRTRPRPDTWAPFRESGYRLLMEAKAARGNVAEALHAYERLRVLLREELGVAPSPVVQAVHRRLLQSAADWCGPALL